MAGGVDGIVGGLGIDAAAFDVDLALGFDGLVVLGDGGDVTAGEDDVAVAFDGLGRHGIVGRRRRTRTPPAAGTSRSAVVAGGAVVGAADFHTDRTPVEIAAHVGADALAALAGVGDGEGAAAHREVAVGLDAGRAVQVAAVGTVHAAGHRKRGLAAVDDDFAVGRDGFLAGRGGGHGQRAVRHDHGVLAAHTMAGGGFDRDLLGAQEADVVVGGDAGLAGSGHREGAFAAEDQLALAEEGRLLVFRVGRVGVGGAVREAVGAPEHHEGALLALVVDGGAVAVGQVQAVQRDGLLVCSVGLEEAVGGGAFQDVVDLLVVAGVVGGHVVAVDTDDPVLVSGHAGTGSGEGDGDGSVKFDQRDIVSLVILDIRNGIGRCGGGRRGSGRGV